MGSGYIILSANGVWLRPVERTVRDREVESSNLSTPTEDFMDGYYWHP